jgi:Domain of unknown function (DUF4394)
MRGIALMVILTLALIAGPGPVGAESIVGLTPNNQIFSFDSTNPGTIGALIPVSGLVAGASLVGIDFQPANPGNLVGVGQNPNGTGNVYTINPITGAANVINTIPALTGTAFGVDFNPVPNALRIVSNANQNLRIVAGGTGMVNTDGALNPGNPGVVGAAYSNNFAGATVTTLYDIGSAADLLFTQGSPNGSPISPNTGTLLQVGALDVDANDLTGFDISAFTGVAFASLTPGAGSNLYTINLATGAATLVGPIDGGAFQVRDIAVPNIPVPGSLALLGMGAAALLVTVVRRQRRQSGSIA